MYTVRQWELDDDFSAIPGQEIAPEIYEDLLNVVPPLSLPRDAAQRALKDYGLPVDAGFLMGEPAASDQGGLLYKAFGRCGDDCYYLGLSRARATGAGRQVK